MPVKAHPLPDQCMSLSPQDLLGIPRITKPYQLLFEVLSFFPQEDGKFLRMCQDDTFYLPRCLPKKQGFSIPETQVITILSLASCVPF